MSNPFTESTVEDAALAGLESVGWHIAHGPDIAPGVPAAERRDYGEMVLARRLRDALVRFNPDLPAEALEDSFRRLTRPEGSELVLRNRAVHRMLVDGVTVEYRAPEGGIRAAQARVIDFDDPGNNDWLAATAELRRALSWVAEEHEGYEAGRQPPVQADSRMHLRELLSVEAGGVVFTTIHKFFPEEKGDRHPTLSERRNIVVIADEAHRSQYDFIDGYARHMRDALPHASFIGFTGTPIELNRFRDPGDPFKLVIVRDMWLTGFDAPSLHTMYVDKPMRGHGLMQAIARVNRVFKDKPGGLVVDYLGLAHELKQALATYTESGGTGRTAFNQEEAVAAMLEKYEVCRDLFHGFELVRFQSAPAARRATPAQCPRC